MKEYKTTNQNTTLYSPVGQMVEIGERGEIKARFCSGFNILEGEYFFSAGHRVFDNRINQNVVVNFGKELCKSGENDTRMDSLRFVEFGKYSLIEGVDYYSNSPLNYAVLKLSPDAARHGSFEFNNRLIKFGDPVVVVQYREGYPKQHSQGLINRIGVNSFCYTAHTTGDLSGSPVLFDDGELAVPGVHVAGDGANQSASVAATARSIVVNAKKETAKWVEGYLPKFGLFKQAPQQSGAVILNQSPTHNNCWGQ